MIARARGRNHARRRAGAVRSRQLDLFIVQPQTPLGGLRVKLDRPVDRDRPCCRNICSVSPGKGPHGGQLICIDCNRPRGWLSKTTAQWIEDVISCFGAPTSPIVVRRSHVYKEEVSDQTNRTRT